MAASAAAAPCFLTKKSRSMSTDLDSRPKTFSATAAASAFDDWSLISNAPVPHHVSSSFALFSIASWATLISRWLSGEQSVSSSLRDAEREHDRRAERCARDDEDSRVGVARRCEIRE